MASMKILWAERNLLNQVAMFSVVGLATSLALTFAYAPQIPVWI
jgi:integral membrane sensor domain MASE1